MAVLKIACRKCGQKVSGDDSFYGTTVECPICSSDIVFPSGPERSGPSGRSPADEPPVLDRPQNQPDHSSPKEGKTLPRAEFDTLDLSPNEPPPALPPSPHTDSIPLAPREKEPNRESPPALDEDEDEIVTPSPILSTVSLVLGILNFVFCFTPALVFAPIGIICGHIALVRARHSKVQPAPGYGMAIAGLVLGYVSFILFCVVIVAFAILNKRFDFVPKS